jgi:hypothetical protein
MTCAHAAALVAHLGQPAQEPLDAPSAKSDTPVDFMGLSNRTCRWPLFEGHEPFYEKLYCGVCPIIESPYCAAHAGQAFTRRSSTAEFVRSPEAPIAPRMPA